MQEATGAALSHHDGPDVAPGPSGRLQLGLVVVVALATLVADQATKVWALRTLADGQDIDLVGSVLRLHLIRNPGAAFSLGDGATWVMTLIAAGVALAVAAAARRVTSRRWAWGLGLILGGALGNLADRFFREPGPGRGHVIDFIDYGGFFVGNVADIAIVGAAIGIAWLSLRGVPVSANAGGRHTTDMGVDS